MIKATGITAEYDPLHNGHVYLIEQARSITSCDAVAVAMSGDYVQRGGPAMIDKWTRCGMALEAGADLVVEIPVLFCLGNAAQYASASVKLLEALGCSHIAFGSECGDLSALERTAAVLVSQKEAIGSCIAALIKEGMSYPAARTAAYRTVTESSGGSVSDDGIAALSGSNDILAIEYIKNMKKAAPVCVKREGAAYNSPFVEDGGFQSASALRRALAAGEGAGAIKPYVPEPAYRAILGSRLTFNDEWTGLLRYAALRMDAEAAEDLPSAGEGLGGLLKASAHSNESWEDIILGAKSKRYTYTRISRLCMQMILGISRSAYGMDSPGYIRVLGFSERGRELLAELRRNGCSLPVITNKNKEASSLPEDARKMLSLDVSAADIYDLVTGRGREWSDHVMRPVIK